MGKAGCTVLVVHDVLPAREPACQLASLPTRLHAERIDLMDGGWRMVDGDGCRRRTGVLGERKDMDDSDWLSSGFPILHDRVCARPDIGRSTSEAYTKPSYNWTTRLPTRLQVQLQLQLQCIVT